MRQETIKDTLPHASEGEGLLFLHAFFYAKYPFFT